MRKKRNFFRYAFTDRVLFIGSIYTMMMYLGAWGAYRLHWYFLGLAIKGAYVIFCALFLLINGYKYWKYKHHKH
jgi:hypothetical protein